MTSAKVWIDRGKSLHERGEYDQAIEAFKRGLNLDPDNDDIMIRIGLSYRYKEEYDTAIEWYGKALEKEPKSKLALNNIGYAYECKKDLDKAMEMYEKALETDPAYELALINLIRLYNNKKEYQKTITVLQNALETDPVNAGNWIDLGLAYHDVEEYDKAIEAYKKAITYEPSTIAYNNLGWTHYTQNELGSAIDDFTASLKIDWTYDLPYVNLNKIYDNLKENRSQSCMLWKKLAEAYLVARDYKYALDCCNRCFVINKTFKGIKELKDEVLKAKRKFDSNSKLNNAIDMALDTFSVIASSVLLSDVIGYIKFKAPDLEYSDSEIKFKLIDFIKRKGLNVQLIDKKLIFLRQDRASSSQNLTI